MTTASKSVARAPVPEFDAVVLGRSFAALRAAGRLRDELRLAVHDTAGATSARYDDVDHRWDIVDGSTVVARAKFLVDGDGTLPLCGRDGARCTANTLTAKGFPNLFRPATAVHPDPVGYTVACIEHMRAYGHDYVERRARVPICDDDFPELSFDRPTPQFWVG
ncbi:hypothetical protein [Rhodococcus aetherivorans]|uniref:hypothetical protein n=1 Tax=Rhodococcus aetherivorans TaxID=191292 RepID=UPI000622C647|nr:hypothetical protein [Rhodococcus aetherivorans]AKE91862.1 hypothetical protein AAT18_24415 [Rhodococcus aetherivorans]